MRITLWFDFARVRLAALHSFLLATSHLPLLLKSEPVQKRQISRKDRKSVQGH